MLRCCYKFKEIFLFFFLQVTHDKTLIAIGQTLYKHYLIINEALLIFLLTPSKARTCLLDRAIYVIHGIA